MLLQAHAVALYMQRVLNRHQAKVCTARQLPQDTSSPHHRGTCHRYGNPGELLAAFLVLTDPYQFAPITHVLEEMDFTYDTSLTALLYDDALHGPHGGVHPLSFWPHNADQQNGLVLCRTVDSVKILDVFQTFCLGCVSFKAPR